jgi:hypothetical protein
MSLKFGGERIAALAPELHTVMSEATKGKALIIERVGVNRVERTPLRQHIIALGKMATLGKGENDRLLVGSCRSKVGESSKKWA